MLYPPNADNPLSISNVQTKDILMKLQSFTLRKGEMRMRAR